MDKYVEPKKKGILGSFLHIEAAKQGTRPSPKKKKRELWQHKTFTKI